MATGFFHRIFGKMKDNSTKIRRAPSSSSKYGWRSINQKRAEGSAANRLQKQVNVLRVGLGRDAMAEVEDMRPALERVHDPSRLVDQRLAARDHVLRVEVALHAAVGLQMLGSPRRVYLRVDGQPVGADRLGEADVISRPPRVGRR